MIRDDFHVELCDWGNDRDRSALTAVREEVFVREQNVPPEMEQDEDDPRCNHVLARALDGTPIGTGRLLLAPAVQGWTARESDVAASDSADASPDMHRTRRVEVGQEGPSSTTGSIGRMAVLPDWRGRGVGGAMLAALLERTRARGIGEVRLYAQADATAFYLRHGFEISGEDFMEAGILHRPMRLLLSAAEAPLRPAPPPRPAARELSAQTREELITATLTILRGTQRSLSVLVRELHPVLLDDSACLIELRRIAISGRGAIVRILAQDVARAQREGNRLLELAQRLPSVFQLRRPVEDVDREYPSAFMCSDSGGYLFRPLAHRLESAGSTCAPGRAAHLQAMFDAVWERSVPYTELRALGI